MPAFPLVDTHLHLWDPGRLRYPWLSGVPVLNRTHSIAEYRQACGPVSVAKMVFIQCDCERSQSEAEVDWVIEVARSDPRIRGIVGHAPLEHGDRAEPAVARLAGKPLVKGIRRLIQSEADDEFCAQPEFVRGVQLLERYGLSFDLCLYHRQLAPATRLVQQCPNVRFVLDHIGKPDIKAGRLDPWRADLRRLAKSENVWCKLSGLVTEADFAEWTPDQLSPYINEVVQCFGCDRVMFGGDWPVSTQASDYPRWVSTLDQALVGCSPDERHKIYVRNAEEFYRI